MKIDPALIEVHRRPHPQQFRYDVSYIGVRIDGHTLNASPGADTDHVRCIAAGRLQALLDSESAHERLAFIRKTMVD
jgi:hypothetical protein